MSHVHLLPPKYREGRVYVDLVGAGGNGSQMLTGLARLHVAMKALGHPEGLHVRVIDPDLVSEANIGRQMFSRSDIGIPKATVLVHRVNLFFGLQWEAICRKYDGIRNGQTSLIVGCVDTAAARRTIASAVKQSRDCYWLDLGNEEQTGQVVLGRWVKSLAIISKQAPELAPAIEAKVERLPLVTELFPHLLDKRIKESATPSCSLAEALGRQDLFINQGVATFALNLLWRLFRTGSIQHHGYYVNMEQGRVVPMPIDPAAWARLRQTKISVSSKRPSKKGKTPRGTRAANNSRRRVKKI